MNHAEPAYGLWLLVVFNSAIFIFFAFSFFKPATARDWRTFRVLRTDLHVCRKFAYMA